eukprot:2433012-Pleurochrysis_carterae.AAC.3
MVSRTSCSVQKPRGARGRAVRSVTSDEQAGSLWACGLSLTIERRAARQNAAGGKATCEMRRAARRHVAGGKAKCGGR